MSVGTYASKPLVSVIILNYNAQSFLYDCITSVLNSTYSNIEIIFVDNASNDNSANFVKKAFGNLPNFKIIVNKRNFGFNEGNNIGFANSKGEYCLFINPDIKVNDPTTIEKTVQALIADEDIGIASPVLLDYESDVVQSAGVYLSFRNFEYGSGEIYASFLKKNPMPYPVAATPGAFVLVRRKLIKEIGLFDKAFFMQGDIDDLSLRAWKRGYRVLVLPTVTVMHYGGGSREQSFPNTYQRMLRGYYRGVRADLAVIIKNLDLVNVMKFLSLHSLAYFAEALFFSVRFKNASHLIRYLKAIGWDLKQFRHVYMARRIIQTTCLRQDGSFMPYILRNLTLSDYLRRFRLYHA